MSSGEHATTIEFLAEPCAWDKPHRYDPAAMRLRRGRAAGRAIQSSSKTASRFSARIFSARSIDARSTARPRIEIVLS